MATMAVRLLTSLVTLLLVVAVASGCGRRGGLERPSQAAVSENEAERARDADGDEEKPDKPFILDGLIE